LRPSADTLRQQVDSLRPQIDLLRQSADPYRPMGETLRPMGETLRPSEHMTDNTSYVELDKSNMLLARQEKELNRSFPPVGHTPFGLSGVNPNMFAQYGMPRYPTSHQR